jgi:hypothetical protein
MSPRGRGAGLFPSQLPGSSGTLRLSLSIPTYVDPCGLHKWTTNSQQQLVSCIHFSWIDILEINDCDTSHEDNEMRALNSGSDSEQHVLGNNYKQSSKVENML